MVPALPGLVAEVIKKHIFLPYDIRSRPNVLKEVEANELADHVDKLVQLFTDVAIQSGYLDGDIDGNVDEIPYVHVREPHNHLVLKTNLLSSLCKYAI